MPIPSPKRRLARHKQKAFAVFPLAMTLAGMLGMAVFALMGKYGAALAVGIASGGLLFVRGTLRGGRLGNARGIGQAWPDTALRLGALLALAGVAAGAQGHDPPLLLAARIGLGLAQFLASVLAIGFAWHSFKHSQSAKSTGPDDISAPL